jgi:hypothetical protein
MTVIGAWPVLEATWPSEYTVIRIFMNSVAFLPITLPPEALPVILQCLIYLCNRAVAQSFSPTCFAWKPIAVLVVGRCLGICRDPVLRIIMRTRVEYNK